MKFFASKLVLAALVPFADSLVIAGCGGGASGGGGGDSIGQSVSIRSTTPSIAASAPVGSSVPAFNISGIAQGNLSSLANSKIYVVMSGGGSLMPIAPQIQSITSDGVFLMSVQANAPDTAGVVSGTLSFDVCLDVACQRPLAGSPLKVSYAIEGIRTLSAPDSAPPIQTTFGSDVEADVPFTLPGYVQTWSLTDLSLNPAASPVVATAASGADSSAGIVHLRYLPRTPGTYTSTFDLRTVIYVSDVFGPAEYFPHQQVTVSYTVLPAPGLDVWLSPAAPVVVRKQGDASLGPVSPYVVLAQDGGAVNFIATQYLSAPTAAQGNALASAWWNMYRGQTIMCDNFGGNCLPSGTYTAQDHYQYLKNGAVVDYWVPVALTVQP